MLIPAYADLECWKNADFPADVFTATEVDDAGAETAMDLTGLVVELQVRLTEGTTGVPLVKASSVDGSGDRIDVVDPAAGQFAVIIPQGILEGLPSAPDGLPLAQRKVAFAYDLKIDNEVYAYGRFIVHEGVTR